MIPSDADIARSLIGTHALPAGLRAVQALAAESRAYHACDPYPLFHFRDWKQEDKGPLPRCMPLARSLVRRGARWLFGKPLQLHVAGNPAFEEFLRGAWRDNRMHARAVPMAENAALDGGIALKWSYDETQAPAFRIQTLSLTDECRLYWHPHDRTKLLMARIQYSYFDAAAGKTMWYREEWTDAEFVPYLPVTNEDMLQGGSASASAQATLFGRAADPDTYPGWTIDTERRAANEFGVIPLHVCRNVETDDVWGAGDLWHLYRVLDRIHLCFHLMDQSNQFDSRINIAIIDGDVEEDDIDKPLAPGEPIAIESKSDASNGHQARVQELGGTNSLRPAMMEYAKDLRKQVCDAAGAVWVDSAEVTNKGNLTTAVLEQLYLPLIEMTAEKRKSLGDGGVAAFLVKAGRALQGMGVPLGIREADPKTYDVRLGWPAYFEFSQDELAALTARTQEQVIAGFLTRERAIDRTAAAEGIQDVKALQDELADWQPPAAEVMTAQANQDMPVKSAAQEYSSLRRLGGNESQ